MATMFGVDEASIRNWEMNTYQPTRRKRIIQLAVDSVQIDHLHASICSFSLSLTLSSRCRALPIYHLEIKAFRPPYPRRWSGKQASAVKPRTVGEHVRRKRLQQHVFQADLAKLFGVDIGSVRNGEQGIHQPAEAYMPRIMAWLGYDPRSY